MADNQKCTAREPGTPRPPPIHGWKAADPGFQTVPPALSAHYCVRNAAVVKVSVLTARFCALPAAEIAESQKVTAREPARPRPRPIHHLKALDLGRRLVPCLLSAR